MKFGILQQMLNPIAVTRPKIEIFGIRDVGDRHLKDRFFGHNIINRLSDISEILCAEAERHADKGHMTKTANF